MTAIKTIFACDLCNKKCVLAALSQLEKISPSREIISLTVRVIISSKQENFPVAANVLGEDGCVRFPS